MQIVTSTVRRLSYHTTRFSPRPCSLTYYARTCSKCSDLAQESCDPCGSVAHTSRRHAVSCTSGVFVSENTCYFQAARIVVRKIRTIEPLEGQACNVCKKRRSLTSKPTIVVTAGQVSLESNCPKFSTRKLCIPRQRLWH